MLQSNEWALNRETVLLPELLLDTEAEQSVELDYVLPDYCPDFFRLLHCAADVTVTAQTCRDGVLDAAFRVQIRVLYCAPDSNAVQTVTQQLSYTRQFPLSAAGGSSVPAVSISAEPAYLNCRAVSSRRIDVRGALRIRARVAAERSVPVLSGAQGLHVRTRSEPVSFLSGILRTDKQFTLSEDAAIPAAQPAILNILRDSVLLSVTETRIAAGKLIVRGEALLTLLYAAAGGTETFSVSLPFSQIVEQEGLSDGMTPAVTATLADSLLTPEAAGDGELRTLHCDLQILLHCEASASVSASLLTDAYSTVHPVTLSQETLPLLTAPVRLHESLNLRSVLHSPDCVLTRICAAWAVPEQMQTVPDEAAGTAVLTGSLHGYVMAEDADGALRMLDQAEPFSWELPGVQPETVLPPVTVRSCTYTLSGADSVTLQTELLLSGQVPGILRRQLLTDIRPDAESRLPAEDDFALRLYFGQPDESLWEIAKRYHISPDAVRAENDCAGDVLSAPQLLLIPNVR
ncbi:MAG: DUF3794 domain-containing protein [Oscillospiraceae bacterium]|nr:DUF3794 domain-containing protein [Oscillospiraceae bacterium]MCR5307173.1 DUF3794 domain-containing protein [Oscillospiraceae bacterium]